MNKECNSLCEISSSRSVNILMLILRFLNFFYQVFVDTLSPLSRHKPVPREKYSQQKNSVYTYTTSKVSACLTTTKVPFDDGRRLFFFSLFKRCDNERAIFGQKMFSFSLSFLYSFAATNNLKTHHHA